MAEYGQGMRDALLLIVGALAAMVIAGAYAAGMNAAGASPTTTAGVLVLVVLGVSYTLWRTKG